MRLVVDVQLPGDAWEGQPAVDAAAVLAGITAQLLRQRDDVGCDLTGARTVYVPGRDEPIGEWTLTFSQAAAL